MNRYFFKPFKGYWFTTYLLEEIICRNNYCFKASLDLGISFREICIVNDKIVVDDKELYIDEITPSQRDRIVFMDQDSRRYEIVLRSNKGFYKLKAIDKYVAPTLEINGIHMHRIKDIDPWRDSWLKIVKASVRKGDRVLDTCLGLGYTALNSLLKGAREIHGFEIDADVLWIAEHNPWSSGLVDERIKIYLGNIVKSISVFDDNYFDKIIHDPPRYSRSSGELYSLEFYRELYRVLKPGGKIYHYTGLPMKHKSILKGISERLKKAGFYPVRYDHYSQGFIGYKLGNP